MAALLGFMLSWNYSQLFVTPALPSTDVTGKTIIVTGSNSGLGLEAARHFVRLNASTVIIAVRDTRKGEAAKESIASSESAHRPDIATCIQVWELDLASYDSVKAFAKRVETLDRVDKVIENAGVYPMKFEMVEEERAVTVNVISTFLLALLLLPKLRETGKKTGVTPTLSIVGSFVHWLTKFPERNAKEGIFEALRNKEKANMNDRYNVTKAMELYIVRELAFLISASRNEGKVILNITNPGFCRSNILREATGAYKLFVNGLAIALSRTAEVGSRTLVAGAEGGIETHGQYMSDSQVGTVAPWVESEEGEMVQKRVWEELSQKLESIQPGILQNI